jgi:hypothetical protein
MLYSFPLRSGRKVTFEGSTERFAFIRAACYHLNGTDPIKQNVDGVPAVACDRSCSDVASAHYDREGGFLICRYCGGYFG